MNASVEVSILALLALLLMGGGAWMFLSTRQTAAQREKRRRLTIHRTGRMGDAMIIDVRDCILYYSYQVGGVAYTTAQAPSALQDVLAFETSVLIAPIPTKCSTPKPP